VVDVVEGYVVLLDDLDPVIACYVAAEPDGLDLAIVSPDHFVKLKLFAPAEQLEVSPCVGYQCSVVDQVKVAQIVSDLLNIICILTIFVLLYNDSLSFSVKAIQLLPVWIVENSHDVITRGAIFHDDLGGLSDDCHCPSVEHEVVVGEGAAMVKAHEDCRLVYKAAADKWIVDRVVAGSVIVYSKKIVEAHFLKRALYAEGSEHEASALVVHEGGVEACPVLSDVVDFDL